CSWYFTRLRGLNIHIRCPKWRNSCHPPDVSFIQGSLDPVIHLPIQIDTIVFFPKRVGLSDIVTFLLRSVSSRSPTLSKYQEYPGCHFRKPLPHPGEVRLNPLLPGLHQSSGGPYIVIAIGGVIRYHLPDSGK